MSFAPAVSLTSQIAEHIGGKIITGALRPDDRVQELRVAKELGVSRGSVREALLILESRALVQILPRRGAVVSRLRCQDVGEIAEVSIAVSFAVFRRLAERLKTHPGTNVSGIKDSLCVIKQAAADGSIDILMEAKFAILRHGLDIIDSSYLRSMVEDLIPTWHRIAVVANRHPKAELLDAARFTCALWDAIERKDIERIEELVGAHCRREARMAQEML